MMSEFNNTTNITSSIIGTDNINSMEGRDLLSIAPTFYQRNSGWIRGITLAMGLQAIMGLILIEYAFSRLKRFRDGNEQRDSHFPAFRRRDVKYWNRCKFYPGALLTMPARMFLVPLMSLIVVLISR